MLKNVWSWFCKITLTEIRIFRIFFLVKSFYFQKLLLFLKKNCMQKCTKKLFYFLITSFVCKIFVEDLFDRWFKLKKYVVSTSKFCNIPWRTYLVCCSEGCLFETDLGNTLPFLYIVNWARHTFTACKNTRAIDYNALYLKVL